MHEARLLNERPSRELTDQFPRILTAGVRSTREVLAHDSCNMYRADNESMNPSDETEENRSED